MSRQRKLTALEPQRVAGSVIWATELKESTTQTGAKGQPETTVYSYSVSFAVASS